MDDGRTTLGGSQHIALIHCVATNPMDAVRTLIRLISTGLERPDLPARIAQLPRHLTTNTAGGAQHQNLVSFHIDLQSVLRWMESDGCLAIMQLASMY